MATNVIPKMISGLAEMVARHQRRKRAMKMGAKMPNAKREQLWMMSTALWRTLDEHGIRVNRPRDVELMLYAEPMTWLEMRANAYVRYYDMVDLMTPKPYWHYGDVRSAREARSRAKHVYWDCLQEYEIRNSMCGQDVIRVYARQGSANWSDTDRFSYADEPWYAGSSDDGDDPSYADIYVRRIWNAPAKGVRE